MPTASRATHDAAKNRRFQQAPRTLPIARRRAIVPLLPGAQAHGRRGSRRTLHRRNGSLAAGQIPLRTSAPPIRVVVECGQLSQSHEPDGLISRFRWCRSRGGVPHVSTPDRSSLTPASPTTTMYPVMCPTGQTEASAGTPVAGGEPHQSGERRRGCELQVGEVSRTELAGRTGTMCAVAGRN